MHEHVGQDPDEVDRLAVDLDGAADALETLRQEVTSALGGTTWSGPDRDRFESDWNGQVAPLVARAADALGEASRSAIASAGRQRAASGAA